MRHILYNPKGVNNSGNAGCIAMEDDTATALYTGLKTLYSLVNQGKVRI